MELDQEQSKRLEEEYDPELQMRKMAPPATWIVGILLATLSCFHYYTAGFGLLRESTHRGIHLAFVMGLIFSRFRLSQEGYTSMDTIHWPHPCLRLATCYHCRGNLFLRALCLRRPCLPGWGPTLY